MSKKKHKQHKIRSFHDFAKVVNEDNIDMLCGNFYGVMKQFVEMRKVEPKLKLTGFDWIDDGSLEVRGARITIEVKLKSDENDKGN